MGIGLMGVVWMMLSRTMMFRIPGVHS